MRLETDSAWVTCPCCGEPIELVVDVSLPDQVYVEDCPVCCRPMVVAVRMDGDTPLVTVHSEDDA